MEYNLLLNNDFKKILNNDFSTENLIVNNYKVNYDNDNSKKYKIIKYNKKLLNDETYGTFGLFRSIILNDSNKVICFSPPKSIPFKTFVDKYPIKTENIIAEEFVEGTMINLFYDFQFKKWEISTKNTLYGNVSFFKDTPTFNTMFFETILNLNFNIEGNCDKKYCYSFVLQHPENRIVVPFDNSSLYLIAVYEIKNETNKITILFDNLIYTNIKNDWEKNTNIKFPKLYNWNIYDDLYTHFCLKKIDYKILGVIIKNKETNERCKLRNPEYCYVKSLMGNQSKIQYNFLILRKNKKINEYLSYYPENNDKFLNYEFEIISFTKQLYNYYVFCFIKKQMKLNECPYEFKPHLYNLHNYYKNELKNKKLFIDFKQTINYVNNLHPSQVMFLLNYFKKSSKY